jgi:hypothetical protein
VVVDYRCNSDDPVLIWADICEKYGFVQAGANQLAISGNPRDGEVRFRFKLTTGLSKVNIPSLTARVFKIYVADDEWNTGEVLSLATWDRARVWAQLSEINPLPHFTQFTFRDKDSREIQLWQNMLPAGEITAARICFPVTWRIETFPDLITQEKLTAGFTVQDAWHQLHASVPRLFANAMFNYSGALQPGFTITAEVFREEITTSISFEVKDNGWIEFPGNQTSNMPTRREIYDHHSAIDPRIPPLAQYEDEDTRPYYSGTPINFHLAQGIPIEDHSDESPGRTGGDNGTGIVLPSIRYGAPPIDTTSARDPKTQGSLQGMPGPDHDSHSSEDSFPTDSVQDTTGEDHRLIQIAKAMYKQEDVTVVIRGHFQGYEDMECQVEFRQRYTGNAPSSRQQLFEITFIKIRDAAPTYGSSGIPGSLL